VTFVVTFALAADTRCCYRSGKFSRASGHKGRLAGAVAGVACYSRFGESVSDDTPT
jgi:hypothetical protein